MSGQLRSQVVNVKHAGIELQPFALIPLPPWVRDESVAWAREGTMLAEGRAPACKDLTSNIVVLGGVKGVLIPYGTAAFIRTMLSDTCWYEDHCKLVRLISCFELIRPCRPVSTTALHQQVLHVTMKRVCCTMTSKAHKRDQTIPGQVFGAWRCCARCSCCCCCCW